MFKYLNQGISTFVAITIIAVLAVVLAGGVFAYQYWWLPKEEAKTPPIETPKDETAGWKTYRNEEYGFSFEYPINDMNILKNPKTIQYDPEGTASKVFTAQIDNVRDTTGGQINITYGIELAIIEKAIDEKAIHKWDSYVFAGRSVDVTQKILIGGKQGYEYDLVSAVNYKIHGIMVPLDNNHFLEISENSKYPDINTNDWKRILSTFKFLK